MLYSDHTKNLLITVTAILFQVLKNNKIKIYKIIKKIIIIKLIKQIIKKNNKKDEKILSNQIILD